LLIVERALTKVEGRTDRTRGVWSPFGSTPRWEAPTMTRYLTILLAVFLVTGLLLGAGPRSATAQFADAAADATAAGDAQGGEGSTLLTAEELNALVAPVALYPDELLAVVLPASTNPLQIVEAQRFLEKQKSDANLKPSEDWDPSVLALINYPEVVKQMNNDLSWTQDLGNAVLDQQDDVLKAIQAARQSASDGGYLQSNDQQTVVNEGDNITIESSNPEVVYVPTYDPAPIVTNNYVNYPPPAYSEPYPPYWYPTATFFAGAFVGAAFAYGFDWDNGDIDIDNDVNISRGDTNIGSGNNIDKTKLQNKFNGERKAGADGKMKWSSQKARQNSSVPRKTSAAQRPSSANIQRQLGGGGAGANTLQGGGASNRVKNNKATRNESQRGNASLSQTKKSQQQLRQSAGNKQQMQRRNQQQRPQAQQRQLKQSPGGGGTFGNMQSQQRVKAQSNRGNRSMGGGGGSRQPRTSRR
jgi:hypothetical protein